MALYHRKFLLDEPDKKYASSCYICYVCPDNCYVTPPPPLFQTTTESKNHQMSFILILMLCVLGIAFLFLSYLTIAKYRASVRNSRRRNLENNSFVHENHGPVLDHPIWYIRTVGLDQSTIDSISMFKYKKGEGLIEGSDCHVCLNEFQEDESLRLLPKCSHAFHVACIDTWLRSHQNCPVCRAPILITNANNVDPSLVIATSSNNPLSTEENRANNDWDNRGEVPTDVTGTENQLADILPESRRNDNKFRVLSDLADHRVRIDQELNQPTRRSVSMDFSSASMIYQETENGFGSKKDEGCSDDKMEKDEDKNSDMIVKRGCKNLRFYRMIKSSSLGRSLEKGPVSMKRSFSFSGKRSIRKNSRSLEGISIPELSTQN